MIKEFIFSLGLPGCGKSTYFGNNYPDTFTFVDWIKVDFKPDVVFDNTLELEDFIQRYFVKSCIGKNSVMVSADDLKPYINGYTEEHPENVHEISVQLAKVAVESLCTSEEFSGIVIMDGGGINNRYTQGIIEFVKQNCQNTRVTCLFFDTPIEVCLKRIALRGRKVPKEAIYDKNQKLIGCVHRYKAIVDNFVRVDYYTNKYIMLDMDGTIAGYSKVRFDEEGNADFVNGELFKHLLPNKYIIEFIKEHYDMNNVYICTACANSIAWEEKCQWLDEHFPEIPKENRLWCGNKDYKYVFVKQFAERMRWKRNEVVLIDDYHPTIDKCKKVSINCIHPSNIDALTDPYAVFS